MGFKKMTTDVPLYNSRIIKSYIEYLSKYYPSIDIDEIFNSAGMTKYNVNDPGHWFSQRQVDRFYEALVKITGNPGIAKDAGRFLASSEGLGPVKQCILGLINPMSLYMLMGKIYPMLSHAATIDTKKISPQKVEVTSTPKPSVEEKIYQCENRWGSFEAGAKVFTNSLATIEHPECIHQGGDTCRYIITWDRTPYYIWKSIRNIFLLLNVPAIVFFLFFFSNSLGVILTLISISTSMALSLYADHLGKRELTRTLETQGNAAEALFNEINTRHSNALLVQEIGQAISTILNIKDLIKTVLSVLEKRSDFDRGLIMLANQNKDRLVYADSFGYNQEQKELTQNTAFKLNKAESKGIFVVAYKEQKPFLIDDISEIKDTLSKRSLNLSKKMGVQSLICVPIVYEKESLGILAVDNIKSKKPLTQSDISLLMGVASQTAVGIVNARSFQKLQESEKKYRDLVENANSIIMRKNIDGTITFFNEFAQQLFGYAENEIIGKNIVGTILPDTENAKRKVDNLTVSLQTNPKRRHISEDRNVLQKGDEVWIAWTYKPIFNKGRKLEEILCIGNDITELKQAEVEKIDLEIRLQRAQKMEAVGTLAGGVAHDLNNILSGIVSYPELIMMGLPENSPLRKPVATMQKSGEKAAAIVQDLLTLARRGVVSKNVIALNKIITDYLKSPEFEYLKTYYPKIQIKTRLGKDLLNVLGSPVHLSKTVMNLVSNAAEAMPDGGNINITTKNRYIDKSYRGFDEVIEGDYVTLIISDDGIGIPSEDIERIFEPFYTKKEMGRSGTGLGMAVVWGTVKDHYGYIDVQSTVGKGSKFTLYFPVSREAVTEEKSNISIEDVRGNGETILVVDDVVDQREIASNMLKTLGYSVDSVVSGEKAVEFIQNQPVDLVVLDMIMGPGMDGYDTYKKILEFHPGQKAIIASGFSETKRVKAAQKIGAGAYVKKPYLLGKIGKAIKEELNKSYAVSK